MREPSRNDSDQINSRMRPSWYTDALLGPLPPASTLNDIRIGTAWGAV